MNRHHSAKTTHFVFPGNIALHVFLPATRVKYDLESLWTVGEEFDENVQAELVVDDDPFAAYLKDFGQKVLLDETKVETPQKPEPAESSKRPYAKLHQANSMENVSNWHD